MLEGLYSAAAGMAAQQERIDALSNDVANVSVSGYKKTRVAFRDLVYGQAGQGAGPGAQRGSGAAAEIVGRTFDQGELQHTDSPLDVAIEGRGFFQVRRPDGSTALTRDGSFQLDSQGRLVTSDGSELGVTLPKGADPAKVQIYADGTVTADGRRVGRLQIVDVTSPEKLQSLGDNLLAATPESGAARAVAKPALVARTLEASNVDLGDAMVDIMDAQRSFQLASRAIQVQDQMMEIANGVKR
jgi:flagellar basal-body rod protein FlgG